MKNKKLVLLIAVILCCCVALQFDYLRNSHSHDDIDPFRTIIHVGNCEYLEVTPYKVRKLHLSVGSCEGLTELGKVTEAYGRDDRTYTFPEIAYVYPDPDYPNLVVASLNGTPTVYAFSAFDHDPVYTKELQQIYGALPADKIVIRSKNADPDSEIEITNPEAIAQFFDAFNALPGDACTNSGNSDDNGRDSNENLVVASPDENNDSYDDFVDDSSDAYDEDTEDGSDYYSDYVQYDAVVYLSNGFRFDFSYVPAHTFDSREIESYLRAAGTSFDSSQALDDWFAAHVN